MQRLFEIKKTQLQMVRDRGYDLTPEEEQILTTNMDGFLTYMQALATANPRATARSLLSRSYTSKYPNGSIRNMLVYYGGKLSPHQKQVSAEIVREFIALVQSYKISEAILIVDAPLSSTGDNELSALTLVKWQVFFDSELTYNPTLHVDTPRHELLSHDETHLKMKELGADFSKLLIIKLDDPIIRYWGWTVGGLVRIHRDDSAISILAPKSINYRVIVG